MIGVRWLSEFLYPCTKWMEWTLVLIVTLNWDTIYSYWPRQNALLHFFGLKNLNVPTCGRTLFFLGAFDRCHEPTKQNYHRAVLVTFLVGISTSNYNWKGFIESIISILWVSWYYLKTNYLLYIQYRIYKIKTQLFPQSFVRRSVNRSILSHK